MYSSLFDLQLWIPHTKGREFHQKLKQRKQSKKEFIIKTIFWANIFWKRILKSNLEQLSGLWNSYESVNFQLRPCGHLSCQMPNSGDESGGQMPRPRDHGSFHTTGFIYYIIHYCRFQRFNCSSQFLTAVIDRSELYSKDFADKYCILYYYF